MKNLLIIVLTIFIHLTVNAASGKYEEVMSNTIEELYATKEADSFDGIANRFIRIGEAEKTKWLPYYYAALAQVFKSFQVEDMTTKDEILDQALQYNAQAEAIDANNSEIIALRGFIKMIKIQVDPQTRGPKFTPQIYADYGKALAIDNNNPRALLFSAQMDFGTAKFFNAGVDEACRKVEDAIVMFDSAEPSDAIEPNWGKSSALGSRKRCEAALAE